MTGKAKTKARKPRKAREKPLEQAPDDYTRAPGDYVRGPAKELIRERDADINDLSANLTRLRALMRTIESGLNDMPHDILAGNMTSGEVSDMAYIAVQFADKCIAECEALSRDP